MRQIETFDNSKDAFRGKTTPELLRALLVFRLFTFDTLVAYQGKVCIAIKQWISSDTFSCFEFLFNI